MWFLFFFFFQAEDGIRDYKVTGVQTCALPIWVVVHHLLPGSLRDFRLGEPEAVCDLLCVGWFFVVAAFVVSRRATHCKPAWGNEDVGEAIHSIDASPALRLRAQHSLRGVSLLLHLSLPLRQIR